MTGGLGQSHPANWVNPVSGRTYTGGTENQDITADYPGSDLIGRRPVTPALNPHQFSSTTPRTQEQVLTTIDSADSSIRGARPGVRRAAAYVRAKPPMPEATSWTPPPVTYRRPGTSAPDLTSMPHTSAAASPPPPSGPSAGTGLSSGPFGPSHPFYAQLSSAPSTPAMPSAAPTAGLGTVSTFQFGSPAGKLLRTVTGKTIDAVGKVAADAARPRASAPVSYTSGPGWRT